jgi:hypothetical protein
VPDNVAVPTIDDLRCSRYGKRSQKPTTRQIVDSSPTGITWTNALASLVDAARQARHRRSGVASLPERTTRHS